LLLPPEDSNEGVVFLTLSLSVMVYWPSGLQGMGGRGREGGGKRGREEERGQRKGGQIGRKVS
jgi:hypothetical protein